jgi:phospholipid transport system transporter-binding protein
MPDLKWKITDNKAVFTGELSRLTIDKSFESTLFTSFHNKDVVIDLGNVHKVDTAGLAWLLMSVENAKKTNNEISLHNVPDDLLKLAKLSAVDFFLPTKI